MQHPWVEDSQTHHMLPRAPAVCPSAWWSFGPFDSPPPMTHERTNHKRDGQAFSGSRLLKQKQPTMMIFSLIVLKQKQPTMMILRVLAYRCYRMLRLPSAWGSFGHNENPHRTLR